MPIELKFEDKNKLVDVLADLAAFAAGVSVEVYFKNLVNRTRLPRGWRVSLAGAWKGDARIDARMLIDYLLVKDINPEDPRVTSVGEVLRVLLADDELGLDTRSVVAAIIYRNRLFVDAGLRAGLIAGYQIPESAPGEIDSKRNYGPDFEWIDEGHLELQSFLQPKPEFLDLGFLTRAIQQAASVCRVEVASSGVTGTGFVLARGLVLTNCHVVDGEAAAHSAVLRFGKMSTAKGKEAEGRTFKLDADTPLLHSSPPNALDYALLKVEAAGATIDPVIMPNAIPAKGSAVHILQHPQGDVMKLASSQNGVTAIKADRGLIQYLTSAAGGSSGAPCFDDEWQAVAIHHAERSVGVVTRREGILLQVIFPEIAKWMA